MSELRATFTYFYCFICFIEKNAFDFAYFTRLDFGNWHFALKICRQSTMFTNGLLLRQFCSPFLVRLSMRLEYVASLQ